MRAADLHPALPEGVMQHWKNSGYSDDWIITQAHTLRRLHTLRAAATQVYCPQCLPTAYACMPAQVAVRSGRRVVNPPWALFLNVVDIVSVGRFYNFMQAQRVQAHPTSSANLLGHRPRSAPRASSRRLAAAWLGAHGERGRATGRPATASLGARARRLHSRRAHRSLSTQAEAALRAGHLRAERWRGRGRLLRHQPT